MNRKLKKKRRTRKIPRWYANRIVFAPFLGRCLLNLALFYRNTWGFVLFCLTILLLRRISGSPDNWIDWTLLGFLTLPFLISLLSSVQMTTEARIGALLIRARWEEALRLLPQFEEEKAKATNQPEAVSASAGMRAWALLGLGRKEEALAYIESLRSTDGVTEAQYLKRVASLSELMLRYEQARDTIQLYLELEPDDVEGWLAAIMLDALELNEPEAARMALDHASTLGNWKRLGPVRGFAEGIVLFAEEDYLNAIKRLDKLRDWTATMQFPIPILTIFDSASAAVIAQSFAALGHPRIAERLIVQTRANLQRAGFSEALRQFDCHLAGQEPDDSATGDEAVAEPVDV